MSTLLSAKVSSRVKLLILALLLAALEVFIPRLPFAPWLKPGFANAVTIVWLYRYGFTDALLFGLLRTWVLSLFFGFSFFTVSLGISGMVLSVSGMWILMQLSKRGVLGLFSVGVAGALLHNMGQLLVVVPMLGDVFSLENQMQFMFPASLVFGGITSYVAQRLILRDWPGHTSIQYEVSEKGKAPGRKQYLFSILLLLSAFALFYIHSIVAVSIFLLVVFALGRTVEGGVGPLLKPLRRSWLFLLCIFLSFLPYETHERLLLAMMHVLKIVTWLTMTTLFRYVQFDIIMFTWLKKIFRSYSHTLDAAVLVVEIFPSILDSSKIIKSLIFRKKQKGILTLLTGEVDSLVAEELGEHNSVTEG